jgi:nanoRNase/pAp phosphatase (c-di-AMP/oligoRNAs hydrolase)
MELYPDGTIRQQNNVIAEESGAASNLVVEVIQEGGLDLKPTSAPVLNE